MLSSTFCKTGALALTLCLSSLAQIRQDHPELCGDRSRYFPIPANLTPVSGAYGITDLTLSINGTVHSTGIRTGEILQVCFTANNRLIVFGLGDAMVVTIIDAMNGVVVDSFAATDPIMSPDQHWLVMRAFAAPRSEVVQSEAYLLYDLRADYRTNGQSVKEVLDTIPARARMLYPAFSGSVFSYRADVPESEAHASRSESFYWSPDSRSVVLADEVHKTLSVVLATIQENRISVFPSASGNRRVFGVDRQEAGPTRR